MILSRVRLTFRSVACVPLLLVSIVVGLLVCKHPTNELAATGKYELDKLVGGCIQGKELVVQALRSTRFCPLIVFGSQSDHTRFGQNHLARHAETGKKTSYAKEKVGRQHQGMDRPGVRQVPVGSGNREKWRKLVVKSVVVSQ